MGTLSAEIPLNSLRPVIRAIPVAKRHIRSGTGPVQRAALRLEHQLQLLECAEQLRQLVRLDRKLHVLRRAALASHAMCPRAVLRCNVYCHVAAHT